ncbi:MAG: hypothetical protein O3A20_04340, partial [Planctomycetota bacterium]|nr:hypothetical protein [Planctomycetota bacterium]
IKHLGQTRIVTTINISMIVKPELRFFMVFCSFLGFGPSTEYFWKVKASYPLSARSAAGLNLPGPGIL